MARLARLCVAAEVHLLVQRGNNRQTVFVDDADRRRYLDLLAASAAAHGVAVHGYALLDSDIHLLATPAAATGLGRMMQALGRRYVGEFNRRHGRSGTLWEGRFRATVVEAARHFFDCLVYVETAPVRAGLAAQPADWAWSSLAHHLGQRRDPVVADAPAFWALGNTPFEREAAYRRRLDGGLPAAEAARIADAQHKGWVLGTPIFLQALGRLTPRPLAPRARGRPRKLAAPTV